MYQPGQESTLGEAQVAGSNSQAEANDVSGSKEEDRGSATRTVGEAEEGGVMESGGAVAGVSLTASLRNYNAP